MSRRLITYCSGGFANRVRPLVSHMGLANKLGREHVFIWENDRNCDANQSDLFFHPRAKRLSKSEAMKIKGADFFARGSYLSGIEELNPEIAGGLIKENRVFPLSYKNLQESECSDIVVLDNSPWQGDCKNYLRELSDIQLVVDNSDFLAAKYKEALGLHIRLTDFRHAAGVSERRLIRMVNNALNTSEAIKHRARDRPVYCATDEEGGFSVAKECFGYAINGNENKNNYVSKFYTNQDWQKNCYRGADAMPTAIRDLYCLAQCYIRIGLPQSTFFQLARELSVAEKFQESVQLTAFERSQSISDLVTRLNVLGCGADDIFLKAEHGKLIRRIKNKFLRATIE